MNDITTFLNDIVPPLKTEVESNFASDSIIRLNVKFNILCDPFKNLNTEHKRFKAFHSLGTLIKPLGSIVGYRPNDSLQRGDVIIKSIPVKIYSVQLEKLFRQFFEVPNVYNTFLKYSETIIEANDNLIHNFIQSQMWRDKILLSDKILIPFFLYFDDFETNNSLGSHAGIQKLGAIYVSLPGCPPEFASKLENIFMVLLFNTTDKKLVGNRELFKHIILEINDLESRGIQICVDNQNIQIYLSLALILGDNLGLHSILGFSESFNANYPCRFCKCSKAECNSLTLQDTSKLRTVENYSIDVNIKNLSTTGVVESCIWNDVTSFHVVHNYSVDLMHDLLEGVCNYDLTGILRLFIIDFKYFSLETLNQRIQYFGYGPTDIRNRPQAISENNLKNNKPLMLKTTVSEMWCLTRYLGLLIGDMVPRNSEIWQLYIVLNKI
ncbi:uncharacterized protein LOC132932521 [Metopolophium dirhodum]|uniref:uncharacterized protein LOC132932521 n=1 Tax=Metopolophium dirhodum TaxID=44670 RepID=UPI002990734F|nr:uncharacterized protein LOC132932521 [Metopolophium dirhodum]